ncbi:MAG: hypothetical protein KF729_02745 [Sandaracinaceae bacterium]|nr:hypothetical protein [Sandaracinaceae bacterium]
MKYRLSGLAFSVALCVGCEGALVIDTRGGGGGGGGGGPRVTYDAGPGVTLDGGARPWDAGPGAPPGCGLPAEGVCDGDIARWCEGATQLFTNCGALGQTCKIVGGRASCVAADAPGPGPGPTPDPGPGPGPSPTTCAGPEEQQVIDLANGARSSPFRCDELMARVAREHSEDMCRTGRMSHTGSDGSSPFQRMTRAGVSYRTAGENVAWGQSTPASVHQAWMNSSGHRANIMSSSFGRIGVGYSACGGRPYWTQVFAD